MNRLIKAALLSLICLIGVQQAQAGVGHLILAGTTTVVGAAIGKLFNSTGAGALCGLGFGSLLVFLDWLIPDSCYADVVVKSPHKVAKNPYQETLFSKRYSLDVSGKSEMQEVLNDLKNEVVKTINEHKQARGLYNSSGLLIDIALDVKVTTSQGSSSWKGLFKKEQLIMPCTINNAFDVDTTVETMRAQVTHVINTGLQQARDALPFSFLHLYASPIIPLTV